MNSQNKHLKVNVDYTRHRVHLLDASFYSTPSLANIISPQFQEEIIEEHNLLQDCIDFDWICYDASGIIVKYKDYNFAYVNPKLPYLFEPFVKICEEKRKKYSL
jgi:hypothetical protein